MRIGLVFPPYTHKIFSENLSTVDQEFCVAPPIILAYVAAIIEQHGHKVKLVDARALNLSKEDVLNELKSFRPDILGFRSETYHFHDALEWIRYLKQNLKIPVITGGINLSLYPKETLSHPEIDYGIIGEAVESLPKLLCALENGASLNQIAGLAYKRDGISIINSPENKCIDFDSYPFPSRHLLSNEVYYSFISQLKNFTIMLTSTGCPFRCSFCAIHPNIKYRQRSPKNVVDEIEICYKEFNIREIDFFDAILFLNKPRLFEIFAELERRKLRIEWSCRSRVDTVDEELLSQAANAGCRQIYYGIESVDQNVLRDIKKGVSIEQIKRAIKLTRKYGIRAMGFFMVGNPSEKKESIEATIEFAKRLDLDYVQVSRTIAKPGTELDKIMIERTKRDYWREHVLGNKIEWRLPTPWCGLSEREIEELTKKFYLKFYFRPKIIWNRLSQLKSFNELKRYLKVGFKMFMQKTELCLHILTDTSNAEKVLSESSKFLNEARNAKVSIVVPTYNEKDNINNLILRIIEILPQAYIVIVDDDSPDGTGVVADELAKHNPSIFVLHRKTTPGLGFAYIDGFRFVLNNLDSEFIFEMDADLSHNPRYLPIFLYYAQNYDLVVGSRFLKRVSIKNRSLWRNVISKASKWLVNLIIDKKLTDLTSGFRCFRRGLLAKLDLTKIKSRGFAFQIEVSYNVSKAGGKIKEIPILFIERTVGNSKMSAGIILEGIYLVIRIMLQKVKSINIF